MGIRLVMESTSRHVPEDLTWRERYALTVLAASAIDATRELPPGIEDNPEIVNRLRLGRNERFVVLKSLCDKGALVRLERGRNGVKATYAIASFGPDPEVARPGNPDAHPVDNPSKHPETPDAKNPVKHPGSAAEASGFNPSKHPETPDAAPYKGTRDFKTGGGTPPPPAAGSPFAPGSAAPPGEGEEISPERTLAAVTALVEAVRAIRQDWSSRSIRRILDHPSVRERPWLVACEAFAIVARDPESQHPGRLAHDGYWWPAAERKCGESGTSEPGRPPWCGKCHQRTRFLLDEFGQPGHLTCPRCHPDAQKVRSA